MRLALFLLSAFAGVAAAAPLSESELMEAERLVALHCAKCHGVDGRGVSPDFPSLAGQPADYLTKQLFNFKTGIRVSSLMQPVVAELKARDVRLLTAYFSTRKPGRLQTPDAALLATGEKIYRRGNPASGVVACVACHGESAAGGATVPRLSGQNVPYLENQLRGFIQRVRTNDSGMHSGLAPMSGDEVRAVAVYLGSRE